MPRSGYKLYIIENFPSEPSSQTKPHLHCTPRLKQARAIAQPILINSQTSGWVPCPIGPDRRAAGRHSTPLYPIPTLTHFPVCMCEKSGRNFVFDAPRSCSVAHKRINTYTHTHVHTHMAECIIYQIGLVDYWHGQQSERANVWAGFDDAAGRL